MIAYPIYLQSARMQTVQPSPGTHVKPACVPSSLSRARISLRSPPPWHPRECPGGGDCMLSGSRGSRRFPSHKVEGTMPGLWVRHADMDDNRTKSRHLSQKQKAKANIRATKIFSLLPTSLFSPPSSAVESVSVCPPEAGRHMPRASTPKHEGAPPQGSPSTRVEGSAFRADGRAGL